MKRLSDREKRTWAAVRREIGAERQATVKLFEQQLSVYFSENPDDDLINEQFEIDLKLPSMQGGTILDLMQRSLHVELDEAADHG